MSGWWISFTFRGRHTTDHNKSTFVPVGLEAGKYLSWSFCPVFWWILVPSPTRRGCWLWFFRWNTIWVIVGAAADTWRREFCLCFLSFHQRGLCGCCLSLVEEAVRLMQWQETVAAFNLSELHSSPSSFSSPGRRHRRRSLYLCCCCCCCWEMDERHLTWFYNRCLQSVVQTEGQGPWTSLTSDKVRSSAPINCRFDHTAVVTGCLNGSQSLWVHRGVPCTSSFESRLLPLLAERDISSVPSRSVLFQSGPRVFLWAVLQPLDWLRGNELSDSWRSSVRVSEDPGWKWGSAVIAAPALTPRPGW